MDHVCILITPSWFNWFFRFGCFGVCRCWGLGPTTRKIKESLSGPVEKILPIAWYSTKNIFIYNYLDFRLAVVWSDNATCFIPGRRACHASRYFPPPPPPLSPPLRRDLACHKTYSFPQKRWRDRTKRIYTEFSTYINMKSTKSSFVLAFLYSEANSPFL